MANCNHELVSMPFTSYFLVYLQHLEPFISDFRCFILNSLSLIFLHDL